MRKRNNRLQRNIAQIAEKIQVKYESLSIAKQTVLVGSFVGIISLFMPWIVYTGNETNSWNAFSSMSGNIGFFLFVILL